MLVVPSLSRIEQVIRDAWSPETTFAKDAFLDRAADRPSRGQCVSTSLVVNDLLGGDLLVADVATGGSVGGVHYWNRLATPELTLDLTGDQFLADEVLVGAQVIERPPLPRPPRARAAYLLLRERVLSGLGLPAASRTGPSS